MSRPIIEVENLSKKYHLGAVGATTLRDDVSRLWGQLRGKSPPIDKGEFWALRDVSFQVQPGEVLGIIGRNGAGKSTLLKILSRITEPTLGHAVMRGRVASLLEVGTGFHQDLTGRENVFLNGAILGMKSPEIAGRFDEIVAFAEVERFIDTPVKHYSSGMYVRLAFAVAAHLEPEILIVDEVLAVGDAQFQRKCLGKMQAIAGAGRTILFVSHNMPSIQFLCSRGILLADGGMVQDGPVATVTAAYASMGSSTAAHAAGRTLAEGLNGALKLGSVLLTDDRGRQLQSVLCGQDCRIVVTLETAAPLSNVTILLAINDHIGTRIAQLNSATRGFHLPLPKGKSVISCRLPRLPLSPRSYDLTAKVLIQNSCVLMAENAAQLVVENGDFYGSGRMPDPEWAGFVQLPHDWSIESGECA